MYNEVLTEKLLFQLQTPHTDHRPVFITGNFCDWYPDLAAYQMKEIKPGIYIFEFPSDADLSYPLEYKYTRGSWDEVELDRYGMEQQNRIIASPDEKVQDFVPRWQKGSDVSEDSMPIVEVLSETFLIPQLNRERKVHILLPHDYYERPDERFPVLYMTDAQNLFGNGSPYGNWEIDKSLAGLAADGNADIIIVAIDHGDDDRIQEFSPYDNVNLGKGLGALFLKFLVDTLKPFVDKNYRTRPDRLNTGMGGSSVGGLLSIYAALMYPHIFARLMIFSPSLWISKRIYFDAIHFFEPLETRIYLYGGGKEGANMIPNVTHLEETIHNQGFGYNRVKIKTSIDPNGEHTEARWSQEFPLALQWLFFN